MKQQEIIEKVLREKLEGAQMEPPAAMFDRIAAQIDKPMVLAWYRRPVVLGAAAAFALLAVSAGLLLNNWPALEGEMRSAPGLASYDSLQQERVDSQLESLKLAATNVQVEEKVVSENKNSSGVQPVVQTMRLASVTESNQDRMEPRTESHSEALTAMESLAVKGLQRAGVKFPNPKKVQVPSLEQQYASADESGILPTLSRSYSLLSDGGLFDLAKERFDDFKTKEHYVSFNLGSLEIGQTFQLSRSENNETTEKE